VITRRSKQNALFGHGTAVIGLSSDYLLIYLFIYLFIYHTTKQ